MSTLFEFRPQSAPSVFSSPDGSLDAEHRPLLRTCERLDSLEQSVDADLAQLQENQRQLSDLKTSFEELLHSLSNLLAACH